MCARFRFERWLFLSAITHSFHARALGVDASMAVSFVAVGVRVSSRFFYAKGRRLFCGEQVFPKSFGKITRNAKISKLAKKKKKKKKKRYNNSKFGES